MAPNFKSLLRKRSPSPNRGAPTAAISVVPSNAVNRIENLRAKTKDTTSFEWAVGSFSKYATNRKLRSQKVSAGGKRWFLECYPRGYRVPDWTSIYLNAADIGEDQWRCMVRACPARGALKPVCSLQPAAFEFVPLSPLECRSRLSWQSSTRRPRNLS